MDDNAADARRAKKALRLHGSIARDLGVAIISGKYRPGDLLTGEIASSERLAVSRSAYREAVRILAAKGLVEAKPKVGTKVSPREAWRILDPEVLSWAFARQPARKFLLDLFELRDIVEPAAAALAAERRSSADLEEMRSAIVRMAHFTLAVPQGQEADRDFHAALLRAAGNPFIASLTAGIGAAVRTTTVFKQRERPLPRDPIPDHRRVFEAIEAKDVHRADKAMRDLIRLAMRDMGIPRRRKRIDDRT
jgi:DNA-binding FadR family transcriptional regulator